MPTASIPRVQIDTVAWLLSLKPEKVQELLNLIDIYQQC